MSAWWIALQRPWIHRCTKHTRTHALWRLWTFKALWMHLRKLSKKCSQPTHSPLLDLNFQSCGNWDLRPASKVSMNAPVGNYISFTWMSPLSLLLLLSNHGIIRGFLHCLTPPPPGSPAWFHLFHHSCWGFSGCLKCLQLPASLALHWLHTRRRAACPANGCK